MFGAWLLARLVEPSTWAGVAVLVPGLTNAITTRDYGSIIQTIGGAIAIIAPEGAAKPPAKL